MMGLLPVLLGLTFTNLYWNNEFFLKVLSVSLEAVTVETKKLWSEYMQLLHKTEASCLEKWILGKN